MLIHAGRAQLYVGSHLGESLEWCTERVNYGYSVRLGYWTAIACWLPKRRPDAELDAELLAGAGSALRIKRKGPPEGSDPA